MPSPDRLVRTAGLSALRPYRGQDSLRCPDLGGSRRGWAHRHGLLPWPLQYAGTGFEQRTNPEGVTQQTTDEHELHFALRIDAGQIGLDHYGLPGSKQTKNMLCG